MDALEWRTALGACLLGAACLAMPPAARAEDMPTYRVVARGGQLHPSRLELPAGRRVKLVFSNEGPGPEEFEITELRVEKVLSPGAQSFAVLPAMSPGRRLRLFGEFHAATAECLITVK